MAWRPTSNASRWRLMIAYTVVALPTLAIGAMRALEANNNSPIDWVTTDFAPRAEYDRFCRAFGPGDLLVASWEGCTINEPRLDNLLKRIQSDKEFFAGDGSWLLHSVTSGREAVIELTSSTPDGLPPLFDREQAIDRLRANLVGPDRLTTAVVATLTPNGLKRRAELVAQFKACVRQELGLEEDQLHLAGPVVDGLSVDQASQSTLARFAAPSSVLVFLLCWAGLRSLRAALMVFALASLCQAATLALVHFTGQTMTALMIVLPPMMQVLAVAGGLHLANYYFDSGETGERGALAALRAGWAPCVLSASTTAIGMASLIGSGLTPIRQFGGYAAMGVIISAGLLLGLLPAMLAFSPLSRGRRQRNLAGGFELLTSRAADHLSRWRSPIVIAGLAAIIIGAAFARSITTSVRIETLFPTGSRILEDYAWIEERVAPLTPLDVVVSTPRDAKVSKRQILALLWRVDERLHRSGYGVSGPTTSAATLAAPLPGIEELPPESRQEAIEEFLVAQQPLFDRAGVRSSDGKWESWRLTVRVSALGDANYGDLLTRVREAVDYVVTQERTRFGAPLRTTVTGIMPLVHEIQGRLLDDLLKSFLGALALITITMTLVQAGVLPGLVAMASNVFPIAVYFGWLGWRGKPIDIGVVMTASVALGIAVDDTLHFLTFYRRGVGRGSSPEEAVRDALASCAPAMVQTSISCGGGLLVLALSDFEPTRGFAISMAALLALALIGDLVLLPALLLCQRGGKRLQLLDTPPENIRPANALRQSA